MSTNDGVSDAEKLKILFKSYMNFGSTNHGLPFYSETAFANHTNIFNHQIMAEKPTNTPAFGTALSSTTTIANYWTSNSSGLDINDSWVSTKISAGAQFYYNDNLLRFERLKLDYLANASFHCVDNTGNNILQNLIPFNYGSSGFSMQIEVAVGDSFVPVGWMDSRDVVSSTIGSTVDWGAPLFDTKNGVITFYDVDESNPGGVLNPDTNAPVFYLTATKYVGAMGITSGSGSGTTSSFWSQDSGTYLLEYSDGAVDISNDLTVKGTVTIFGDLVDESGNPISSGSGSGGTSIWTSDASNNILYDSGAVDISNDLTVKGTVTIFGDLVDESGNLIISSSSSSGGTVAWNISDDNNTSGDLAVGGNITMGGDVVATESFVTTTINNASLSSSSSGGGGSATVVIANQQTFDTIDTANDVEDVHTNYKFAHKTNQPPSLTFSTITSQSQSIDISWDYFDEVHYVDAYDGRVYPLSFQTYVDISFDSFGENSTSTNGWKTLYVGGGKYDSSGNKILPLEGLTIKNTGAYMIDSDEKTDHNNDTNMNIYFDGKVDTLEANILEPFSQSDTFDLRIYSVNQSQRTPNYTIYSGLQLKATGTPGVIEIIDFDNFAKNSFEVDLSFNIDSLDPTTTTGIDIVSYDVSLVLTDTKSWVDRSHVYEYTITQNSENKDDISITGLYPGAKYDVQMKALNSANPTYGSYNTTAQQSDDFTNNGTNQYISTSELSNLASSNLAFTLGNSANITCTTTSSSTLSSRKVLNNNGSLVVDGSVEFYVNYGLQGRDMTTDNTELVNVSIDNTNSSGTINQSYGYTSSTTPDSESASTNVLEIGDYKFNKGAWVDKGNSTENEGFVYSTTFESGTHTGTGFTTLYNARADPYSLSLTISSESGNNTANITTSNSTISIATGDFYVDSYSSTPTIAIDSGSTPTLVAVSKSSLCGIPSISSIKITGGGANISNFADNIIPHSGSNNSTITMEGTGDLTYSTTATGSGQVNSNTAYDINYNDTTTSVSVGNYDDVDGKMIVTAYYLGESSSGAPEVQTITDETTTISTGGKKIFRSSTTSYSVSNATLYRFQSDGTTLESYDTDDAISNNQLIYFDGKFVSSGYANSSGVNPFIDWTAYLEGENNYSTTSYTTGGINGYKYIGIKLTGSEVGAILISMSRLKVSDDGGTATAFHTSGRLSGFTNIKLYIYADGAYGRLHGANFNTAATTWGDAPYATMAAAESGNGAYNATETSAIANGTTVNKDHYLIVGIKTGSDAYFTYI